jgi:hypothetical protein
MKNTYSDNLSIGALELAKRSTLSFSLEGWPAAMVLMSIPLSVVLIYGIKSFS